MTNPLPAALYLAALSALAVLGPARAEERFDAVNRVVQLAAQSEKAGPACDAFIDRIAQLDSPKKDLYSSKPIALKALKLAKDYPGTPQATERALMAFGRIQPDDLPHGPVAGDLRTAIAKLQDCRSIDYFGILNRLLASRARYHFTDAEDADLRALIERDLARESSGPRLLFQVQLAIELLGSAVKELLILPSPDLRLKIDSLLKQLDVSASDESAHLVKLEAGESQVAATDNINELKVNHRALKQSLWQLQESERLRRPLGEISAGLK